MKVHSLEHGATEGACRIRDWALERGHSFTVTRLDLGETLPEPADFGLLVIMGGPMNIYQHRDFPWLVAEKRLMAAAVEAGKAIIGVCLGAQLLADVLGGKVMQNPWKEIGWMPVEFVERGEPFDAFPAECVVFHWHGDTFSLPPGAKRIAQSVACENQGFVFGNRVIGLQFHIEVTPAAADAFCEGAEQELQPARYVQTREQIHSGRPDLAIADAGLFRVLDYLAARVESGSGG